MEGLRQWNKGREHGEHAIVQASFAVGLAAPTPLHTVRELQALHSKFKGDYPRERTIQGAAIGIPELVQGTLQLGAQTTPIGFIFDSLKPNGEVLRSISLDGTTLSVQSADYLTWEETWAEVRSVFAQMLPLVLSRSELVSFHLHYHDRFVWEREAQEFKSNLVFREGSPFIAQNVFAAPELWHNYHGYFEYPEVPSPHQLLTLAEVQLLPPENVGLKDERGVVADLKLTHRAILGVDRAGGKAKPVNDPKEVLGTDEDGLLDAYMTKMHDADKWLLARLITDELCDEIGIDRPT